MLSNKEILAEIKRITDLREKDLHEYRRVRAEAEKLLYRTLLADSQLMDLQNQLIDLELKRRETENGRKYTYASDTTN